jgi:hypothetical protein
MAAIPLVHQHRCAPLCAAAAAAAAADCDVPQMGQTAMHIAALWGNQDALRALLDCGGDVNVQNSR